MDAISKALAKLTEKERAQIKLILLKLASNQTRALSIAKLKGQKDIYRIRSGKIRIIFKYSNNQYFLLAVERRSDNTYRKY